jgi:chromosome segregation ATPase
MYARHGNERPLIMIEWKWLAIIVLSILLIGETGAFIYVEKNNSYAVADLRNKLSLLGQQLDDSIYTAEQLREQNRQLSDKLTIANDTSDRLAKQLSDANTNVAVLTEQLKRSGKLSDDLKNQLATANANVTDISGQLERSQQYSADLTRQLGESNAKLDAIKSVAANLSTDSTDAKSIIGQLRLVFKQLEETFGGSQ